MDITLREGYTDPWVGEHRIRCNSGWWEGRGRHFHAQPFEVKACYAAAAYARQAAASGAATWPCDWLLEGISDEDGSRYTYPCTAPARYTSDDMRYECTAGHSHVPAEARAREGWDYATRDEAAGLLQAGTTPVPVDGNYRAGWWQE